MRVNLAKDPSLRSRTTDAYTALEGAVLDVIDDYGFYGKYALRVIKSANNGSGIKIARPIAVDPGKPYAFSIYTRLPVTIPNTETAYLTMQVTWLNSFNVVVSTSVSATLEMDDDGQWYRLGGVWTAPASARYVDVSITQNVPGSVAQQFIVDALLIEQSNYIGGYFDNVTQAEKNAIVTKGLSRVPQVVNGVRLGADISLNGLVFNTIDEDDTVWIITDVEGWWGQTDPDIPNIERGTEDGSYDVEGRLSARSIVVEGFFIPKDTEASLSAAIDRLVTATSIVRKGGWFIANEAPTKAAFVRLSGKPEIRTVNARGRTTFSIVLRAADPIKYHWNDSDPQGFTAKHYDADTVAQYLPNIGTADVTGVFTITGPVGAGTRIYNASTDQTMTLREPLRGRGLVAKAYEVWAKDGLATIRTTAPHTLRPGDDVQLLNMVLPFSESSRSRRVLAVSNVFPYTFSFEISTDDIELMRTNGQVLLVNNDTLKVDTYNRSVTYNAETVGHRHRLTTLTDWIKLAPGDNVIQYFDDVTEFEVVSKQITSNVVTLTTADPHMFILGEEIVVDLPVTAALAGKGLESNVVTLTTERPHGFAVGDKINVETTEQATIINKSRTSGVVSLTTETPHGVSTGDSIKVAMPTKVQISTKELTSNVVSLESPSPHGFSEGDSVTVAMPTSATLVSKQLANGQVTLTTSAAHGFSAGDSITVNIPESSTVVKKARVGSLAVLTTSTPHGYSVGDVVGVNLPITRTPTARSINGTNNFVTLTTSATHGYSVGDVVTVSLGIAPTLAITTVSATTTTVTLTTSSAHSFSVGEKILISLPGLSQRYNGETYISAVTSTTISYSSGGTALASTATTGTVTNVSIQSYYNGSKIIEAVPSGTTFTYRAWDQAQNTSSTAFGAASVTNQTNLDMSGTKTLTGTTSTTFSYSY